MCVHVGVSFKFSNLLNDFNLPLEEELDTVDYLTLTELKAELAIHIHELNKLGYGCL